MLPRRQYRCLAAAIACLLGFPFLAAAQEPETVGTIEGAALEVKAPAAVAQALSAKTTTLFNGSEVKVREGHARITLNGGGEIDICGPASFSVLKSGDALTLALNFGRVHARIAPEGPLVVYSPLVTATLVSIGSAPRDAVIGLDADGAMCVRAAHGAVRLEHQFSGQRTLVPQYAEMSFAGGELDLIRAAEGGCRCDIPPEKPAPVMRAEAPPPPKPAERKEEAAKPVESNVTFTAVMPPLAFDARRPANPPEPRPEVLLVLREVRVQPVATYSGRVEPRPKPASAQVSVGAEPAKKTGFSTKFKNFFRRLFGGKPR